MSVLYIIGIRIIYFLIAIASLFNSKAKFWIKGRRNIFAKLKNDIDPESKIAWFHCASLGEFEQGRPVIESFKTQYPDYKIILTFYSPSGYEIRKNYTHADYIYYLPIDTPSNARKFVEIVNPNIVFFIKYEFWYYYLNEINQKGIPLYMVSGIFREDQRFFKRYSFKTRRMLHFFNHFYVQNEESHNLLKSIGIDNVTVTGDTRFDRVYEISKNVKNLDLISQFKGESLLLVAGSTWKADEDILVKFKNEFSGNYKIIFAPHEIHKENINRLLTSFNKDLVAIKYSDANKENVLGADVLIIDSIGLLSSLYKYGDFAYIGGGFGKGIHNTLEAATFGVPILFGPNYLKFQEAIDLAYIGAAFPINDYTSLEANLSKLIMNQEKAKEIGELSADYVAKNKGATQKILNSVNVK